MNRAMRRALVDAGYAPLDEYVEEYGGMTDKLSDRIEAASAGSRELDAEIAVAIGWTELNAKSPIKLFGNPPEHPLGGGCSRVPKWTASLDAAMKLVPEGCLEWEVEHWDTNGVYPEHVRATAWVKGARRNYAATPALALCAAALRARGL